MAVGDWAMVSVGPQLPLAVEAETASISLSSLNFY